MTETTIQTISSTLLPPDPDGMNDDRAGWADAALSAFQAATGTDREDAVCDLLCDLMHLCDREAGLGDFDTQLERARGHYEAETGGPDVPATGSPPTPGPWTAHGTKVVYRYDGGLTEVVADVRGGSFGDAADTAHANARMLAAAPDLLEALDELLRQTIDQDLKYGIGLTEGEHLARRKALAAIAKAHGFAPSPADADETDDDREGA